MQTTNGNTDVSAVQTPPAVLTAGEISTGEATYSPEDNKLRLYVGRLPREEFLKLRADGWVTLHKQREAGGGDFVTVWTPSRRATALEYGGGIILDEDMGPAERAADRAERFGGYRDKRTEEATGHADRYDAGPSAHGYQSQARADRAAARHDRIADRAGDAWSKAEYWTGRTAGVIRHALHLAAPGVRMGRIKTIEAEKRKLEASRAKSAGVFNDWKKIAAITDPEKQTSIAERYAGMGYSHYDYAHPANGRNGSLWSFLNHEAADRITGAQAAAMFLELHTDPASPEWQETTTADWLRHYELRLAYENQMLSAQGGRLEQFEVLPGGKLGGKLIIKVSKSSATKRATSCDILGPKVSGWTYKAANIPGTEFAAYKFDLERLQPSAYTAPTPESLAELKAFNDARKANAPKSSKPPLINPTDADAERLQAVWNDRARAEHEAKNTWHSAAARASHTAAFKPSEICRIAQAVYSANSGGTYSKAETRGLCAGAQLQSRYYGAADKYGAPLAMLRVTHGDSQSFTAPERVIILTDKPQKPFPAAVWETYAPAPAAVESETVNA